MTLKRLLALACAVSLYAVPAGAADLGGNCCADIEERVAELEAITAHKGNRKQSVTIYGQVNRAMIWGENLGLDKQTHGVIDNSTSPTYFGLEGSAKLPDKNLGVSVGYKIEIGLNATPALPLFENQLQVRHSAVWLETQAGKFTIGHTSMATDKIVNITTANTEVASRMLSLAPISTVYLLGFDLPFTDIRRDLVRYDTPIMGGFILSASYANGDTFFSSVANVGFNPDHAFDVAVRWAGETKEVGGWRLAAGAGYRDENYVVNAAPISFIPFVRDKVMSGSASLMSMSTGLFVNVALAKVQGELLVGNLDYAAWQVQAGWEKNVFKVGKTTLFAEYGEIRADHATTQPKMMGLSAVQAVDSLATDFYVSFKQIDLDDGSSKASSVMVGARVRF